MDLGVGMRSTYTSEFELEAEAEGYLFRKPLPPLLPL